MRIAYGRVHGNHVYMGEGVREGVETHNKPFSPHSQAPSPPYGTTATPPSPPPTASRCPGPSRARPATLCASAPTTC